MSAAAQSDGTNNPYGAKPWLALYDPGQPAEITPQYTDALAMFRAAVARAADKPALLYFDARLSYSALDELSDALALLLQERGFTAGDRLGVYLQNVPQFVIAMLAAWKAGGTMVPVNPMNRQRELTMLFNDCAPQALVCHDDLYEQIVSRLDPGATRIPATILTTSALDFQTRRDPRLFASAGRPEVAGADDLMQAIASKRGQRPRPAPPARPSDLAFLVYTSGTTGVPKGAMNTHGNVAFNGQAYRDWIGLEEGAPILGMAPLFHITGLIGHVAAALITAAPLILSYRFEPGVILDAAEEHGAAFSIGSITAFIAMMHHKDARREQLATMTRVYSGGAPIPPSVVEQFRAKFGHYIHNAYGLTETNSPTHFVPLSREATVDPDSGALAIGVPIYNTMAWIAAEDGSPAPVGEVGEIVSQGPMVVPGYWNKPQETAASMRADGFRTGDVGFMDQDGWFYLVDRKKDMINAAGYKVWPREVEDVLYTHPAVREAAVVGVKDEYRGETVKAVISVKAGASVTPDEIVAFCRERMAAYKYPRMVEIIEELPKTPTGKILRRELR